MRRVNRLGLYVALGLAPLLAMPLPAARAGEAPPPAANAEQPAMDLDAVAKRLKNYFTEEELVILFDYMRDVSIASLQGKGDDVLLPPDLAFKMAILQERMMREGQFQMQLMLKQLERDIDRALKDLFTFPPPKKPEAAPAKPLTPPPPPPAPARPVNPYLQPSP